MITRYSPCRSMYSAHGGFIAEARAVAPQIAALDVVGVDHQRIAFPLAGRESRPAIGRILGRMRAAVHIDHAIERPQILDVNGAQIAPDGIHFVPESHAAQRAPLIGSRMRAALKLGQAPLGMVVAVGLPAAGVVERNPLIIAQRRPAGSLVAVFVNALGPDAGKVGQLQDGSALGENRPASQPPMQARAKEEGSAWHPLIYNI